MTDKPARPENKYRVTTETYCEDCGETNTIVNEGPVFNVDRFAAMLGMKDTVSIKVEKIGAK